MTTPIEAKPGSQQELTTSQKVNLVNAIISEELFDSANTLDSEKLTEKLIENLNNAVAKARLQGDPTLQIAFLEKIFGDLNDSANIENAAKTVLSVAQIFIDEGVRSNITESDSSYTPAQIGEMTARLRTDISAEKKKTEDPNFDPKDGHNLDQINFAYDLARKRLEHQALERARQSKEKLTKHSNIKNVLKKLYGLYHSNGDSIADFAELSNLIGVDEIDDEDIENELVGKLEEVMGFYLFIPLDRIEEQLNAIVQASETPSTDNPEIQLITLKNELLSVVTNLESELSKIDIDSDDTEEFNAIKNALLTAVGLLVQDYVVRYEAVAPKFVNKELEGIINVLTAVIEGDDIQDPNIRNILRPSTESSADPYDTSSLIKKGFSKFERDEQTRVVKKLEQQVAIVLGDEDRANKYEHLTFTQSLDEIVQLVQFVEVDPSLILGVDQYWSQYLVGSDTAAGFDLANCFNDTDLHAVAALQSKLTNQRAELIQAFLKSTLSPEQQQVAIEAVCVIDLCRNRLKVVLREVSDAQEAAGNTFQKTSNVAGSASARREFDPLPETSNQLVMNYRKASLAGFFRKFMTEDVSGSEAIEAWSQVLKEKAARIEATHEVASKMSDFMMALDGPVEFKLFNVTTADFASLTSLGAETVEKRLSEDAIKAYDAFRSNEVYAKVVEKIGDLAYYLMIGYELEPLKSLQNLALSGIDINEEIENLPDEVKDKIYLIKKRIRFLLGEEKALESDVNEVLQLLIRYKNEKIYDAKNEPFKFDWDLITKESGDKNRELLVRDWTGKGDWSNGDQLIQFCAEIIYKYNPDARNIIEGVDEVNSDKDGWIGSEQRRDIPNLLMYIAQADSSLRERRKKAAEFHLLYSQAAFKFKNSTNVWGTALFNYIVYKVVKNSDTDSYASATGMIEPDERYVKKGISKINERYNEIIKFFEFRFTKFDSTSKGILKRFIDKVKYKQRLTDTVVEGDNRNQIAVLGSASVPLSLDDFLTNYNKETGRESAADYGKLKQTVETLDSMFEKVVNAWGNDQTEHFASLSESELKIAVDKLFQTLGSDIAKAFAYTSSLPETYNSELFEIFRNFYQSFTIYILGQLKRNPYKFEDTEYDKKYEVVCTAVRGYFQDNGSFGIKFKPRDSDDEVQFVEVMEKFFDEAFIVLKQSNKYVSNNLLNQYIADIQKYNYAVQLRDEAKRKEVEAENIRRRLRRENEKKNLPREQGVEAAVASAMEKNTGQQLATGFTAALKFIFTGGNLPNIDLSKLSKIPKWPFGTKTNKNAAAG